MREEQRQGGFTIRPWGDYPGPISGCGFGDQEAVRLGVRYALEKLQPKVFIPLHALNNEYRYREFIEANGGDYPLIRMVAPKNMP